jgi:tetrachloro-p-hydroquinone reductive dehalogenase
MSKKPILFHVLSSYYSAIARLVLIEKHIEYKSVIIDMHIGLEHFAPWYVSLNPNITIPTMIHGNNVMASSVDILPYVDSCFEGPKLTPEDEALLKEMSSWIDLHNDVVIENLTMGTLLSKSPFMHKKFMGMLDKQTPLCIKLGKANPTFKKTYDDKIQIINKHLHDFSRDNILSTKEAGEKQAIGYLDQLETRLLDKDWLLGSQYTLCDIVNTSFFGRLEFIKRSDWIKSRPKCEAYWSRLKARPSFEKAKISCSVHPHQMLVGFCLGLLRRMGLSQTDYAQHLND